MPRVTPIPLTSNLASRFALESAAADSPWSRWSYFAGLPTQLLESTGATTTLRTASGLVRSWPDPLSALGWLGEQCGQRPQEGPPFKGGWLGYLSYDLGRYFERLPSRAADDLNLPLYRFTYHDRVQATDGRLAFDCHAGESAAALSFRDQHATSDAAPRSVFTRAEYEAAVSKVIEYIAAGDVFQVNLAQRFSAGLPMPPRRLYARLRERFPAWFGGYFDYGDFALLSNSPELFLRVTPGDDGRKVITRPIKGTRPRGDGMAAILRASPKDTAELNMIVDLERNDLGRVCEIGSVRVEEPRVIEAHPTVFHGAATVAGTLRRDVTFLDLLRATFPGGSVSGAPKIRAMEIIEELEPVRRGPYCGAMGYLSVDGHIEFNVAIRTMIARHDRVHFSVGGGIVADSEPAAEYDETIVKARAMVESLRRF